jgi:hypothetical protein
MIKGAAQVPATPPTSQRNAAIPGQDPRKRVQEQKRDKDGRFAK